VYLLVIFIHKLINNDWIIYDGNRSNFEILSFDRKLKKRKVYIIFNNILFSMEMIVFSLILMRVLVRLSSIRFSSVLQSGSIFERNLSWCFEMLHELPSQSMKKSDDMRFVFDQRTRESNQLQPGHLDRFYSLSRTSNLWEHRI